jgi:hypothetical protein
MKRMARILVVLMLASMLLAALPLTASAAEVYYVNGTVGESLYYVFFNDNYDIVEYTESAGNVPGVKIIVPSGKRAFQIFLTPKGREIADKVFELMEIIEEECFVGISEEERQQLFDLLRRVRENLHRSCEKE